MTGESILTGSGAITQEYLDDVAKIKHQEIDKKQLASKVPANERSE